MSLQFLISTEPNPTTHFQFKAFWKELFQPAVQWSVNSFFEPLTKLDRSQNHQLSFPQSPFQDETRCELAAWLRCRNSFGTTRATTEEAQHLPRNDITSFSHLILCSTACWKKWPLLQQLSIVGQCNGGWWVNLAKPSVRNRDQLPPVPPYRRIKGGDTSSNHFVSSVLIRCFQFFLKAWTWSIKSRHWKSTDVPPDKRIRWLFSLKDSDESHSSLNWNQEPAQYNNNIIISVYCDICYD